MNKLIMTGLLVTTTLFISAQKADDLINAGEAKRIETVLASDDMMGRKAFTPYIDKAADFIASEFNKNGLAYFPGLKSYKQEFSMVSTRQVSASCAWGMDELDIKNLVVITCESGFYINEKSGYEKIKLEPGKNLTREAQNLVRSGKNYIVIVDTSYTRNFSRLNFIKRSLFKIKNSVVFVLTDADPETYTVEARHEITEQTLSNVVGIIPGKSRKSEFVIFSGHYDHIGVGRAVNGDSIYNGANDDAAGTTAVIMLSKYFKTLNNNERTIVFVAFTAEEMGGYGSRYFSEQLDPETVVAMFNIEMIGTESKWGRNSAYITGYEKTDMGSILQKNLEGTGFNFYPDPYTQQNLFYRSDNATLARLGVPAHTISTSKMDSEPNYHKVSDEIGTLDMENMALIIKAIAVSSESIIAGKDAPSRVNTDELR